MNTMGHSLAIIPNPILSILQSCPKNAAHGNRRLTEG